MDRDINKWLQGHLDMVRASIAGPLAERCRVHRLEAVSKELEQAVYALNRAHNLVEKQVEE